MKVSAAFMFSSLSLNFVFATVYILACGTCSANFVFLTNLHSCLTIVRWKKTVILGVFCWFSEIMSTIGNAAQAFRVQNSCCVDRGLSTVRFLVGINLRMNHK